MGRHSGGWIRERLRPGQSRGTGRVRRSAQAGGTRAEGDISDPLLLPVTSVNREWPHPWSFRRPGWGPRGQPGLRGVVLGGSSETRVCRSVPGRAWERWRLMDKRTLTWGEVTSDGGQMNVPLVCFSFPLYEILGEWVSLRSLSQRHLLSGPAISATRGSDGQLSTVTIVFPGPCPGGPNPRSPQLPGRP